ncbi:MAG: hypothetical protein KJP15_01635 [Gammaproteobacteria bacterium]|nr:hypothetical protein [Gammaproteobacteria bacterium]
MNNVQDRYISEQATETQRTAEQASSEAVSSAANDGKQHAQAGSDFNRAELQNLADEPGSLRTSEAGLDVMLDMPLTLSIGAGRTIVLIHDSSRMKQ